MLLRCLDADELRVLGEVDTMRAELHYQLSAPLRWTGLLRQLTMARAVQGSNTIEGFDVTLDDALAALEDAEPADTQVAGAAWQAVTGYRDAMTYCLQLSEDPHFTYSTTLLRSLHFIMLRHELAKMPGRWRPGPVMVIDEMSGRQVHDGPDATTVPGLMEELTASLDDNDHTLPPIIRAAIAHLNLAMIHPFKDGNGRMARILQSLVLAREGIIAAPFASIEEYLGRHTRAYYHVLVAVGGGSWQPDRDTGPWIRFVLTAHHHQAVTIRRRVRETSRLWDVLEHELARRGLSDRAMPALAEAARGARIRRPRYAALAEVEDATATRDLRLLTDSGLLIARGEKRGRFYEASAKLTDLRQQSRDRNPDPPVDPFSAPAQRTLDL